MMFGIKLQPMAKVQVNNKEIYKNIISSIQKREFAPVYMFHGEEAYLIDKAIELIENNILSEEEKEFNQTIIYGADSNAAEVVNACRRLPMMNEYQVVILKEAQSLKDFKELESYLKHPVKSTIFAIGYKNGSPDGRMQATKILKSDHQTVECELLYDSEIPSWIASYLRKSGLQIEERAAVLFSEFTGKELSRIVMECDKLKLNFAAGYKINTSDLERFVGLNKEYSIFDLNQALSQRDVFKSNNIAKHFASNDKAFPLPAVIALLYGHFSKALALQYLKSKGEHKAGNKIGIFNELMLRQTEKTASNYSPAKIIHIIHHLRKADLQSKGFYSKKIDNDGVLKELVFKILH